MSTLDALAILGVLVGCLGMLAIDCRTRKDRRRK